MPTTRSQATRGAVAGVVAAGIWALQQPLDQKLFGVRYDDTELLGKLVTRGSAWPAAGTAMHLLNGAAFGAVYSQLAPRLPLPGWARGPAVGLLEHLASWPLTLVTDKRHPARGDMPRPGRQPARVRPGHLAPPAVRHDPRRARAPAEPAGRGRGHQRRGARALQRARRHPARLARRRPPAVLAAAGSRERAEALLLRRRPHRDRLLAGRRPRVEAREHARAGRATSRRAPCRRCRRRRSASRGRPSRSSVTTSHAQSTIFSHRPRPSR